MEKVKSQHNLKMNEKSKKSTQLKMNEKSFINVSIFY